MLQRAGRRDMIHGAEQWGGLEELGELLEYQVRLLLYGLLLCRLHGWGRDKMQQTRAGEEQEKDSPSTI